MDRIKQSIIDKLGYMFYIFDEYPGDTLAEDVVPEIRGMIDTLVDLNMLAEESAELLKENVAEINRTFWNDYLLGRKARRQWRKKYAKAVEMVKAL